MSSKPASKIDTFWPITAAVWRNESSEGKVWYSVTFERAYKDREGKTQSSTSFNADDLLTLAKVADLAHTELHKLRAADRSPQIEERQPGAEG